MLNHPDFYPPGNVLSLITDASYSFTVEIPGTMTPVSFTFTTGTQAITSTSPVPVLADIFVNDAFFQTTEENTTITTGSPFSLALNLTCSQGGASTITYSLTVLPAETLPAWLNIDSTTGELTGTPPSTATGTTYPIIIVSSSTSFTAPVNKPVNLEVIAAVIPPVDAAPGSGKKYIMPDEVKVAIGVTITSIIVVAAACTAISTAFLISGSSGASFSALWSIFNQLQLMIFLTFFDSYIHEDVLAYIEAFEFVLFNFNFLKIKTIPGVKVPSDWMDAEQPFKPLSALELDSRSTVTNCYSLI